MAPFEHLITSATVEIDTSELPEGTDPIATANQVLDQVLAEDIERADESSATPQDETYLQHWKGQL